MTGPERFVEFECAGHWMTGILHLPAEPCSTGILMIGRTGSDRQGVHFGRAAAARGIPVFRFDFRGRGDCEGPVVPVEETGTDIACAIEAFLHEAPSLRGVVIWGLSEGAAAALLYAAGDPRVAGLILVNPWIRMDQEVAKEHLRQNLAHVFAPEFWQRIRKSEGGYLGAAKSFLVLTRNFLSTPKPPPGLALKDRLMEALTRFAGPVEIILSGGDPATAVFQDAAKKQLEELEQQGRLTRHMEPEANHVFSRSDWREHLIAWSLEWTLERFARGA